MGCWLALFFRKEGSGVFWDANGLMEKTWVQGRGRRRGLAWWEEGKGRELAAVIPCSQFLA